MKCSIHNSHNNTCKNGDIIAKDGRLYLVIGNGIDALVICNQSNEQSHDYINIPLLVSQYIKDPYAFYSMLIDHRFCPFDCKVMEIHLCPVRHKKLISKYFEPNEKYRYTIIYPEIYEINKDNMYCIKTKKL